MKEKYLEAILKLSKLLLQNEVPHEIDTQFGGYAIRIKDNRKVLADAVIHPSSYGSNQGLFEIMDALTEEERKKGSILGYLSAEEVAKRFAYCYKNKTDDYVREK